MPPVAEDASLSGGEDEEEDASAGDASASQGSAVSRVVDPAGEVGTRDVVDLRSGTFCRVIMTQRGARRVCGYPSVLCKRNRHSNLRGDATRRALPSRYLAYFTRAGEADGMLDHPYSDEEYEGLRLAESNRRANLLQGFDPGLDDASMPSLEVVEDPQLEEEDEPEEPGPGTLDAGQGPAHRVRSKTYQALQASRPVGLALPIRAAPNLHYGLENLVTGDREVTQNLEVVKYYVAAQWQMRKTFRTLMEAAGWQSTCGLCHKAHPGGTCAQLAKKPAPLVSKPALKLSPTVRVPQPALQRTQTVTVVEVEEPTQRFFGMEHPESKDRIAADSRDEANYLKEMGFCLRKVFASSIAADRWTEHSDTRLPDAARAGATASTHATRVGKDASTNDRHLFDVHMDLYDEMDAMCLPAGTTPEEADGYYDCAADVMALPGGYKSAARDDEDEVGDVAKALMTIATGRQETGLHMRYSARSQNGLREIKGQEDLSEFLEEVHEGWDHANETMTSQLTRKMSRAGHSSDSVTNFIQNGVLIRIVRDSYNFYTLFLTTLSGYANRMNNGEVWKDSVAGNLLSLHLKQFVLIRSSSATYRELVLRNYAYLRNQHRTAFWNDKLSKKMAFVTSEAMARLSAPSNSVRGGGGGAQGAREDEPATRNRNFCTDCKRIHVGRPCPAARLTVALRTKLGANLRQRDYEKALKHLKEALAANPTIDHTTAVDNARRAAAAQS